MRINKTFEYLLQYYEYIYIYTYSYLIIEIKISLDIHDLIIILTDYDITHNGPSLTGNMTRHWRVILTGDFVFVQLLTMVGEGIVGVVVVS